MHMRMAGGLVVSALALTALVLLSGGCGTLPAGTFKDVKVGNIQLTATGAGIVRADAQKVAFKIKCETCGKEVPEMIVETPVPGKPYTMDWICPQCGHKQKIVITASAT